MIIGPSTNDFASRLRKVATGQLAQICFYKKAEIENILMYLQGRPVVYCNIPVVIVASCQAATCSAPLVYFSCISHWAYRL